MARRAREAYEAALVMAREHARREFPLEASVRWFVGYRNGGSGEALYHHGVVVEHPIDDMDGMFRCREHAGGRVVRVEFDRIETEPTDGVPLKPSEASALERGSGGTVGGITDAQKSLDKPSAWATALLIRAVVADDAMAASVPDTVAYRRLLIERLNGFISEAGGPSFDAPPLADVPVIDLKVVGYDYLMEIAHTAPWLPPEYTENDILADIRSWLETSYVHGLDAAVDVESSEFLAHFEQWWEKHGQNYRAGGGEYEKTFAYHAAQHYARCARNEDGWRKSQRTVQSIPTGFHVMPCDDGRGPEIAVACPSGNAITVANRGRLAERILFELGHALIAGAAAGGDEELS